MEYTGRLFDDDGNTWKEGQVHVERDSGGTSNCVCSIRSNKLQDATQPVNPVPYWNAALAVVNAWSRYQAAKKAQINAGYEETRHKVQGFIEEYWGGAEDLRRSVECRSEGVREALEHFAKVCENYGIEPVSRDWLYHNLSDAKEYARLRGKIARRLDRPTAKMSVPCSLGDL